MNEYDALIKSIKRKRKTVVILTIVAVLIAITLCSPIYIGSEDNPIVDYKGIPPVYMVIIIVAILIIEIIAYGLVSIPLVASMEIECNPEKHLILNDILNNQKNKDNIYSTDFLYMGNFKSSLEYSIKMVSSDKPPMITMGLFNKARCEFFLGDFDSLKATVTQYENTLNSTNKINQKVRNVYDKILKTMNLLVAISNEDKEQISAFSNIEVWNNSKATECYVNYLKGLAAFNLNDKEEAVSRLTYVKENGDKTVFAQFAEEYLFKLNNI